MDEQTQNLRELPIDGILDLHTFDPKDIRDLIPAYIKACLEKRIFQIRIIHGKGRGVLRRIVHSVLEKYPAVKSFRLDTEPGSSWGATLVELEKKFGGN